MKKTLLFLFMLILSVTTFSQAPIVSGKKASNQHVTGNLYIDSVDAKGGNLVVARKVLIGDLIHSSTTDTILVMLGDTLGYILKSELTGADTSLWLRTGYYLYPENILDSVGIGTATPSYKLDVDGIINTSESYKIDGYNALSFPNGNSNIALGYQAGNSYVFSSGSIFIGISSGFSNTTGGSNTFIGANSGYSNITGINNVFLGNQSGYYELDSNKLYIENSNDSTGLIVGDFNLNRVGIDMDIDDLDSTLTTKSGHFTGGLLVDGSVTIDGYVQPDYIQQGIDTLLMTVSDSTYEIDLSKPMQVIYARSDTLVLSLTGLLDNYTKTCNVIIVADSAVTRLVFGTDWDGDDDNWLDTPPTSIAINKRAILSISSYGILPEEIIVGYKEMK